MPAEGFWRWESAGDVLDDCALYTIPFNYGLTLITEATEASFTHELWGNPPHQCSLASGDFVCESQPLDGFLPPAEFASEFDGNLVAPEAGSAAFRFAGDCKGPECAMLAMERGIEFPCESSALVGGQRMADVALEDEGCGAEGTLLSTFIPQQAVATFINDSAGEITLYWLDDSGERVDYGTVAPGDTRYLWTYLTHPWLIADTSGACLGIYLPTDDAGFAVIR